MLASQAGALVIFVVDASGRELTSATDLLGAICLGRILTSRLGVATHASAWLYFEPVCRVARAHPKVSG